MTSIANETGTLPALGDCARAYMDTLCATPDRPLPRMKIHEYQAKELFRKFGVPVPNGKLAKTPEEARQIAGVDLGTFPVVVKAQIPARRARQKVAA